MKARQPSPTWDHSPVDLIPVIEIRVYKFLAALKPHKAAGPGRLPARMILELAPDITPYIRYVLPGFTGQGHCTN